MPGAKTRLGFGSPLSVSRSCGNAGNGFEVGEDPLAAPGGPVRRPAHARAPNAPINGVRPATICVQLTERHQKVFVEPTKKLGHAVKRPRRPAGQRGVHIRQHLRVVLFEQCQIRLKPGPEVRQARLARIGRAEETCSDERSPRGIAGRRQERRRGMIEDNQIGPGEIVELLPGLSHRCQLRCIAEAAVVKDLGKGAGRLDVSKLGVLERGLKDFDRRIGEKLPRVERSRSAATTRCPRSVRPSASGRRFMKCPSPRQFPKPAGRWPWCGAASARGETNLGCHHISPVERSTSKCRFNAGRPIRDRRWEKGTAPFAPKRLGKRGTVPDGSRIGLGSAQGRTSRSVAWIAPSAVGGDFSLRSAEQIRLGRRGIAVLLRGTPQKGDSRRRHSVSDSQASRRSQI